MQWNRSNAIGLAKESCSACHGDGLRLVHKGREVPCHCVFRAVFRACYNRFRDCVAHEAHTSSISLEFCRGKEGRRIYSRKREDYVADFCLVSRRVLSDFEYKVFRFNSCWERTGSSVPGNWGWTAEPFSIPFIGLSTGSGGFSPNSSRMRCSRWMSTSAV